MEFRRFTCRHFHWRHCRSPSPCPFRRPSRPPTPSTLWTPPPAPSVAPAVPTPPTTGGAPPPPPPPPPPPAPESLMPKSTSSVTTSDQGSTMGAVFSQLNQGEGITKSLKHVDKSQMTHKNPSLREKKTSPTPAAKPASLR